MNVVASQRLAPPFPLIRQFGQSLAFQDARRPRDWMNNRVTVFTEQDLTSLPEIDDFFKQAEVPLRVETLPSQFTARVGRALTQLGLVMTGHDAHVRWPSTRWPQCCLGPFKHRDPTRDTGP